MDEFDSNTIPSGESHDEQHVEGSSRRTFLKAAVVGSATAVAVSGVGAAAFTLTGHHTGLKKYLALTDTISGVTGDPCTTDTSGPTDKTAFQQSESVYFWTKFNAVPAGQYTIDVSPTIPDTLVKYQTGSDNVWVYNFPGGASFACHPSTLPDHADALASATALSITFTTPSDGDVLLEIHLQGQGVTGNETLTTNLYQGPNTSGTLVDAAPFSFSFS